MKILFGLFIVLFCLIQFGFSYVKPGTKYRFQGTVESVGYSSHSEPSCYISINAIDYEYYAFRNHKATVPMCEFAERARLEGALVNAYAKVANGGNVMYFIEFAKPTSKWWTDPKDW